MTHTVDTLMALADDAAEKRHNNGAPAYNSVSVQARKALRTALTEALAQPPLMSLMSWGGFNLYGDDKSVWKANSMLHDSDTVVPALKQRIRELQAAQPVREQLHVGDSSFESWYESYPRQGISKQVARDAYAAGMSDPLVQAQPVREPLSDEQIEKLRDKTFSINNPFCPVDSKSMRKAVRAAERAHGIGGEK
jgi:hypothetical protein